MVDWPAQLTRATRGGLAKSLLRSAKMLRFAPLSAGSTLRGTPQLSHADTAQANAFTSVFGQNHVPEDRNGHLLIVSYLPLHYTEKIEFVLARALLDRGWRVSVMATAVTAAMARAYFGKMAGVELLRLEDFVHFRNTKSISAFLDAARVAIRGGPAELKKLTYRGAPLALHAMATMSGTRPDGVIDVAERNFRRVGRLLRQSALWCDAAAAMYESLDPSLVLGQEKGFTGTCETFYMAIERGIPFVQWVSCQRPESVMLKRYGAHNLRDHPFSVSQCTWESLKTLDCNKEFRTAVFREFETGYKSGEWFKYKRLSENHQLADRAELVARLGLDPRRKTAVIYAHILNDANLFYGTDLFPGGYEEWLVETVRAAAANPSVNWVLKLHPANVFRNRRVGYTGEPGELIALRSAFGRVPEFLRIVDAGERISPFSFFRITDWGITVRGTVGMELPCFGIPVLTAGSGRYTNKGFTVDSTSAREYLDRIGRIQNIPSLTQRQVDLGVMHAYLTFCARPARYDSVLRDMYPMGEGNAAVRDVTVISPSGATVIADSQIDAIADFLESDADDFLDYHALRGVKVA